MERYKESIMAKGFTQIYHLDYEEICSPIARKEKIRFFLSFPIYKGLQVNHIDVKSAFLNGYLDEEVYV